jgi:hypothetical protein
MKGVAMEKQRPGQKEMTDEEIRQVFETMGLPTLQVAPKPKEPEPIIFFRISGDSPPMKAT